MKRNTVGLKSNGITNRKNKLIESSIYLPVRTHFSMESSVSIFGKKIVVTITKTIGIQYFSLVELFVKFLHHNIVTSISISSYSLGYYVCRNIWKRLYQQHLFLWLCKRKILDQGGMKKETFCTLQWNIRQKYMNMNI